MPGASCTYEFNGINSYIDIETYSSYFGIETHSGGTLHINTKCETSLKNGPTNKKLMSHGIAFWTCYTAYDNTGDQSAVVSNSTSTDTESAAYVDFADLSPHYLRGTASKSTDTESAAYVDFADLSPHYLRGTASNGA